MSGCSDKYVKTYSVFEKDNVDVGGEDFISDRVMEVAFRILHFLHQPQHPFFLSFWSHTHSGKVEFDQLARFQRFTSYRVLGRLFLIS